jgi:hypothetical protein
VSSVSPTRSRTAVVAPSDRAIAALRPLPADAVRISGGFWAERLRRNHEVTIPHGFEQLTAVGTLENFRLAAGAGGRYRALGIMFDGPFPFLDSDVYKWLEAVGWELGRAPDDRMAAMADEAIKLVVAAQQPDGYINTFTQVVRAGERYRDMPFGHEMYSLGHLLQAAVAWHRGVGDDRLLEVARRAADELWRSFGPDGRDEVDGHPEVEMALVELFRATGEARYLELARLFVERRGHGRLGDGRFGRGYWQDHAPVREATSVTGHAVRQLYLDCGVVDVATETGDRELLDSVRRRWLDMTATRSYLTNAVGSRHKDEAFGDPYELPPDRAYAETCAAIARLMLGWRLLLATGEAAFADDIERTLFNAVLPGLSLDGASFFYVNPLQRRTTRAAGDESHGRAPWYACACCPPNLMRTLAELPQLVATTDDEGIQLHQFVDGEVAATLAGGGRVRLAVTTGYPWTGRVDISVLETPADPWTLSLRRPRWSGSSDEGSPGARREHRAWRAGDSVALDLDTAPRVVRPHPRIDAVRGCVAVERGPLVYAIESADLPGGVAVEDVALDPSVEPRETARDDIEPGMVGLALGGALVAEDGSAGEHIDVAAIPYFAWGNRGAEAMRVWIPAIPPARPDG